MKTLVILHGWQSSKEKWQKVKEEIEKTGIKVVVPDLPGFKSETELQKPWNLDNYTDWFEEFISSENISEPFFLLGHSFGGALAAKFTLKYPEKVEKLFLVASACIRRKTIKKWFLGKMSKTFKVFAFLPFFALARKAFYKFVVGPTDYLNAKGKLKQTFSNIISEDLSPCLSSIKNPTIIIWGDKDKSTPLKDGQFIKKQITNSKIEIIPGAEHYLNSKNPKELTKIILNNI